MPFDEKRVEEKKFSQQDMIDMIKQMSTSNTEAFKAFAKDFAYAIAHPEPTEEEKAKRLRNAQSRIDMAREAEAQKKHKRDTCAHKRVGQSFGMFNGSSLIAWHYTNFSAKDKDGIAYELPTVAIGVCQHCHSEFKPGDPDYAEKLSWGTNPVEGNFPMHKSLGIWM